MRNLHLHPAFHGAGRFFFTLNLSLQQAKVARARQLFALNSGLNASHVPLRRSYRAHLAQIQKQTDVVVARLA